jgi:hypothetical protein
MICTLALHNSRIHACALRRLLVRIHGDRQRMRRTRERAVASAGERAVASTSERAFTSKGDSTVASAGECAVASARKLGPLLRLQGPRDAHTRLVPCQHRVHAARATETHLVNTSSALGRAPVLPPILVKLSVSLSDQTRSGAAGAPRVGSPQAAASGQLFLVGHTGTALAVGADLLADAEYVACPLALTELLDCRRARGGGKRTHHVALAPPRCARADGLGLPREELAEPASEARRSRAVEERGGNEGAGPGVPASRWLGS